MTERHTASAYKKLKGSPRPSKYGAKKATVDGIKFDSQKEARRWSELKALQAAGQISDLKRQVKIYLNGEHGPIMTDSGKRHRAYVADFKYHDHRLGAWVIEDSKGMETPEFKLKRAILAAQNIKITVT